MTASPLHDLLVPERWPVLVLITARLGGLMLTAPMWSMSAIPGGVRAAITLVLSAALLPACPPVAATERVLDLPIPFALELGLGVVIGLTAAVVVQGVTLAGEVIALQMGLSLGPALAPMPDAPVSGVGQLQSFLALTVYLAVGGHLMLIQGLAHSLQVLPPGAAFDAALGARAGINLMSMLYSTAIRAAAPVMVTLVLANLALAVLSRAVPQLNAMMVAFPFTIGLGLLMLGASLPVVAPALAGWMQALPRDLAATTAALGAARIR